MLKDQCWLVHSQTFFPYIIDKTFYLFLRQWEVHLHVKLVLEHFFFQLQLGLTWTRREVLLLVPLEPSWALLFEHDFCAPSVLQVSGQCITLHSWLLRRQSLYVGPCMS